MCTHLSHIIFFFNYLPVQPDNHHYFILGRMFAVGTLMGPLHHYYYLYLDKMLPKVDIKTVVKKIVCDQMFASPATIVCFFYGMGIFEGKSISESTSELTKKFKFVYMVSNLYGAFILLHNKFVLIHFLFQGDCLFWPPAQFVNFYYLPSEYRVVYINLATMVFNVFLSYMKHYDQH